MSRTASENARQLGTLERLRSMELEETQHRYSELAALAAEKKSVAECIQCEVDDLQNQVRESLSARPMSVDVLRRLAEFSELLAQRLSQARLEMNESHSKADEAREILLRRFEQLSIIERLRERRAIETSKQDSRRMQQQLDELALTRCGGPGKDNRTGE